jgi:nucleoside-diphosphate-sugar epimerase
MKRVWIAGGTGYIGSATVNAVREAGFQPVVLTRSSEKAKQLRSDGVEAVVGDLGVPGEWAHSFDCEHAVFLAAPPTWGRRVSSAVAREFRDGLLRITQSFFGALRGKRLDRVVYIAGTSFYGDAGDGTPRTEDETGAPKGWGPYLAPAVQFAEGQGGQGVPLVVAFPGQVYGPDSWNEQLFLKPIAAGKAVTGLRGYDPLFSPIHVDDCGRAIAHLLSRGEAGRRYLLVDGERVRVGQFAEEVARVLGRPLHRRNVPRWLCSLLLGPVLTEYATAHTNFSSARLIGTGFQLRYPTYRDGLPDVVRRWQAKRADSVPAEGVLPAKS